MLSALLSYPWRGPESAAQLLSMRYSILRIAEPLSCWGGEQDKCCCGQQPGQIMKNFFKHKGFVY